MKTGGRLIRHARYYWLLLAESHLTRRLFGSMVRRIEALPVPADKVWRRASKQVGTGSVQTEPVPTGRRKERNGEVYERSLGMRHFQVLTYLQEAELAPTQAAGVARDEKKSTSGGSLGVQ
jgi:hypothetical protein